MRVLVACEFSGTVRDAFARRGHDAWSCDLLPSETEGNHIQGDVLEVLAGHKGRPWDMMIAHPPCTHLATSGAAWFAEKVTDGRQQAALELFLAVLNALVPMKCIENPVGIASTRIRPFDQIVHPWQFGHEAEKTTCLWLENLPRLRPTEIVAKGEFVVTSGGRKMPKWYSNSKGKTRSRTFRGIAEAMAEQWGSLSPDFRVGFGVPRKARLRKG